MDLQPFRQSVALLFTRRFGTFWAASFLSNIGTWAQQVAQPWLLLTLGASPFLLGVDSFALGGPVWLLILAGGLLADRTDRRRVILGFQSLQMLCPIAIVGLIATDRIEPWMVVSLSLVVGVTDALSMPSFQSIVPSMVKREQIATGYALNSAQFNISRIAGPAIAGMLMASVGALACFALNAASYIPFIGLALWILPRPAECAPRSADDGFDPHHPFAPARMVLGDPYLRGALLTVLCTNLLCGPLLVFVPVLVKDAFNGDVGHFSSALASFGLGGLLGALGLLFVDPRRDRRAIASASAAAAGLVLAAVALDPWLDALPALLVCAGVAVNASNTSANSMLQAFAPAHARGQTVSLYTLALRGGTSLGALATGVTISEFGIRHALQLNAALAVLVSLAVARTWFKAPVIQDH